jgi:hypothetical protein
LSLLCANEPEFDPVARDFLLQNYDDFRQRCTGTGLVSAASLGQGIPWLYRLKFRTRGLRKDAGSGVQQIEQHTFALRFLPDYLRRADRFEMLRLLEPTDAFHPNISATGGAVCIEIYPGESLLEICQSLHDLLRWRLRQYQEHDALNHEACAWGRAHVEGPIDDRPLFGRRLNIQLERAGEGP